MKDKWQEIELLAYHIWEREGRPEGRAEDHWEQALTEWEALARRKTKAGATQTFKTTANPPPTAGVVVPSEYVVVVVRPDG